MGNVYWIPRRCVLCAMLCRAALFAMISFKICISINVLMRVHISVYSLVRRSFDHPFVFFFFRFFFPTNEKFPCVNDSFHFFGRVWLYLRTSTPVLWAFPHRRRREKKLHAVRFCKNKTGGIRRVRWINLFSHKMFKENLQKSILMFLNNLRAGGRRP